MAVTLQQVLDRLHHVRPNGTGFLARCPVPGHGKGQGDTNPSLHISEGDDGRVLMNCFAGCEVEAIVTALGITLRDLFPDRDRGERGIHPQRQPRNRATATHHGKQDAGAAKVSHAVTADRPGLTLAQYAAAKRLPLDFLRGVGLSDMWYMGKPAVRMVYPDPSGQPSAVRFRLALNKCDGADDRFRWKKGDKPGLYGLHNLERAREAGSVVLVEGESDTHTLWFHDVPALGIPGADNWNESRDAPHLDAIPVIYVVIEPDQGGETIRKTFEASRIRERVRFIDLGQHKDASGLYLDDTDHFVERWQAAMDAAVPWVDTSAQEAADKRSAAWSACESLACEPRILDVLEDDLHRDGVVGESRTAKLIYLVVTSRLLARPASAVVKGPSSAGKSFLTEQVLRRFPPDAYYALSAMSERALIYSQEPLIHRHLVIYEAAGLSGDFASYLIRSLLSEGRIKYETVERTRDGLQPRFIEREGPTGLLVTTTALHLHAENETRLLSIPVTDTQEQTRRILMALADEPSEPTDVTPWLALQTWIAMGAHDVTIPYAHVLNAHIPPIAVRLRRDVQQILTLIRAHALLHQATRTRDEHGRIVASLDDYAVVRDLVADLIADVVEATVPATVRETVNAVRARMAQEDKAVMVVEVARDLKLDKSAAYRRVQAALDRGYLDNLEERKGRPARLVLAAPLPDDVPILPTVEQLADWLHGCTVAEGQNTPSPSTKSCAICGKELGTRAARDVGKCPTHMSDVEYADWVQRVKTHAAA